MSHVETHSTGWFGRIGGSLKGMLFGGVLLPVAIAALFFNERNAVRDIRANEETSLTLIALAWLAFRPLVGIPLLGIAVARVVGMVVMAVKGRTRKLPAP